MPRNPGRDDRLVGTVESTPTTAQPSSSGSAPQTTVDKPRREAWAGTHRQLKKKEQFLQTAMTATLPRDMLAEAQGFEALQVELDAHRVREHHHILQQAAHVRKMVRDLHDKLASVQPGAAYLDALEASMSAIQHDLTAIKDEHRGQFEELARAEALLERNLELFLARAEGPAWMEDAAGDSPLPGHTLAVQGHGAAPDRRPATSCASVIAAGTSKDATTGQLLPEVVEFDAYEEEYGTTGNWHEADHAEFLKLLKAVKGDYAAVVLRCMDCMIGYDRLDIIAHARWHSQYEEKLFRKRAAIADWREARAAAAAAAQADALKVLGSTKQPRDGDSHARVADVQARQYTKEVLSEWKLAKQQEQAAADAAARAAQSAAQQAQQERLRSRQALNALKLREYHEHKAEAAKQAQMQRLQENQRPKSAPLTPGQVQVLQERNRNVLAKRAAAVQAVAEKQRRRSEVQQTLLAKVHVAAPRDPSRLLQPTAAFASRLEAEKEDAHEPRPSGYIRNVQHKVTPAWTKR